MFMWIGQQAMMATLLKILKEHPNKVAAAMYREAQVDMTESKRRVPLDTGLLRSTGTVHRPEKNNQEVSVNMSYGGDGPARLYAVIQHEHLGYNHANGRQAKYLESVLNESVSTMGHRLAIRLTFDGPVSVGGQSYEFFG